MSFDAVGIVSGNPDKTIKFYKILGVNLERFKDTDHFEGKTSSGVRIMMDSEKLIKMFHPEWKRGTGGSLTLCFKQKSPKELNKVFEQVTEAGFKSIKVATHYSTNGKKHQNFPNFWNQSVAAVYEEVQGWPEFPGTSKESELPGNARKFIERIEEYTGVPIVMISTGQKRDEMIIRDKRFS